MSMGLVAIGALLGIGSVIWPLRMPGAISLGLSLWAAAAFLKIVREYLLGIPFPLPLFRPFEQHERPLIEKEQNPIRYALYLLFPLLLSALMFTFLLMSALQAFRGNWTSKHSYKEHKWRNRTCQRRLLL
jgi:hypothetical protein